MPCEVDQASLLGLVFRCSDLDGLAVRVDRLVQIIAVPTRREPHLEGNAQVRQHRRAVGTGTRGWRGERRVPQRGDGLVQVVLATQVSDPGQ